MSASQINSVDGRGKVTRNAASTLNTIFKNHFFEENKQRYVLPIAVNPQANCQLKLIQYRLGELIDTEWGSLAKYFKANICLVDAL